LELINTILLFTAYVVVALLLLVKLSLALTALLAILFRPLLVSEVLGDLRAIRERDPAAEGWIAAAFYPGWWALTLHRLIANPLYRAGLKTPARLVNFLTRFLTGTDIHPGATFGRGIFIDHAHGVVIGETAIVGDNVTILHQVTLGGTGKEHGKRHPTVEEGVLLSAGSKILGNITIGHDSKIGAGSVVVRTVDPESTVVGVPGRVVLMAGARAPSKTLDQTNLPDPIVERMLQLQDERRLWERKVEDERKKARAAAQARDILVEIVAHKREEVAAAKAVLPLDALKTIPSRRGHPRSFLQSLQGPGLALIAEIKRASPSAGLIRKDFDPVAIAKIYEENHAAAISVLTDAHFFQGSLGYLAQVRETAGIPLLRKDFIIDAYQIVEAARAGADAVLLIAACLDDAQLRGFRETAQAEGLDALVEVHDEEELDRALESGALIVGINNRNLNTLEIDLSTTIKLAARLSAEDRERVVLVSESGIHKPDDLQRLAAAGVKAVLIGEAFMKAPDIGAKVREILGVGDYAI
jgi:indole-3-glycerol phosphate synthase